VVSYNATTFHDRDRRLQGVFAAARDMTELKRFEQTLQQKEDASRMKSEFLANMSHELRTPLNAIIGFSEVLRDGLLGQLTDQQRKFTTDIFSSGQHLLSLINDILDLSKVEAGKMTLDLEPVEMSSLFGNSLSIIREKAATRRISLEMDAAEELGSIQVDARKVKQILYNLLSNAVKFTNEGRVTLRAGRVPRADVCRLSSSRTRRCFPLADNEFAEFLEITVSDSGIGISPEGLEQLFKPFSQIDSGLARKYEGTGLGLAMVKLLAELHGGAVAVESAVDEGSCFTVWLPFRPPEEKAHTPAKAPAAPGLKTMGAPTAPRLEALARPAAPRLEALAGPAGPRPEALAAPAARRLEALAGLRTAMVVEDDYKAAALIRAQLEAEGFKVLHAASAEAALVLAVQQPLSLITLDVVLPDMDGWEFLSRIKQVPDLRRIPVVIISGVEDPRKGFSLGAAAVMQKPVTRKDVYESLVDLGLLPLSHTGTLKVLVVDDDPKAVELIAVRTLGLASTLLRAYGGREAIEIARRELPDVIVLDLMMPEVNGFDVVVALNEHPDTARIPIIVVTAKQISTEDRAKLSGYVTAIVEKAGFDTDHLTAEIRRAMSGRQSVALVA
jgi:signal transduction histidine kinase/CheY-like chemotaxis protein